MERQIRVALFDRTQRAARLSATGHELIKHAEQLINLATAIQHRIADPAAFSGNVRLGVTELVAVTWLPKLVSAINENYPRVVVELDVDLTLTQLHKLEAGSLDLTIMPGPIEDPRFTNVPLGRIEFAWMASPKLGLPRRKMAARPPRLAAPVAHP